MNCSKCDTEMEFQLAEQDVGIMEGGYQCGSCDVFVSEYDAPREPMEGDVQISFASDKPLGTPASELSTQPGQTGYEEWVRICRSWGRE